MEDVINKGTGTPARLSGMTAAGKTGTTENSTDLWLSAFTPYYTGSVWTGYDENKHMENIYDQSWHMRIWKNIMERIHEGLPDKDFEIPSSVVQKTICTQTGKLAVSGCSTLTEYFASDNVPTESCAGHKTTTTTDKDDKDDDKDTENNTSDTENSGNTGDSNTGDNSGGNTGNSGGDTGSGSDGGNSGNTGGGSGGDTGGGSGGDTGGDTGGGSGGDTGGSGGDTGGSGGDTGGSGGSGSTTG